MTRVADVLRRRPWVSVSAVRLQAPRECVLAEAVPSPNQLVQIVKEVERWLSSLVPKAREKQWVSRNERVVRLADAFAVKVGAVVHQRLLLGAGQAESAGLAPIALPKLWADTTTITKQTGAFEAELIRALIQVDLGRWVRR